MLIRTLLSALILLAISATGWAAKGGRSETTYTVEVNTTDPGEVPGVNTDNCVGIATDNLDVRFENKNCACVTVSAPAGCEDPQNIDGCYLEMRDNFCLSAIWVTEQRKGDSVVFFFEDKVSDAPSGHGNNWSSDQLPATIVEPTPESDDLKVQGNWTFQLTKENPPDKGIRTTYITVGEIVYTPE